jgi:hypothetical protein
MISRGPKAKAPRIWAGSICRSNSGWPPPSALSVRGQAGRIGGLLLYRRGMGSPTPLAVLTPAPPVDPLSSLHSRSLQPALGGPFGRDRRFTGLISQRPISAACHLDASFLRVARHPPTTPALAFQSWEITFTVPSDPCSATAASRPARETVQDVLPRLPAAPRSPARCCARAEAPARATSPRS